MRAVLTSEPPSRLLAWTGLKCPARHANKNYTKARRPTAWVVHVPLRAAWSERLQLVMRWAALVHSVNAQAMQTTFSRASSTMLLGSIRGTERWDGRPTQPSWGTLFSCGGPSCHVSRWPKEVVDEVARRRPSAVATPATGLGVYLGRRSLIPSVSTCR